MVRGPGVLCDETTLASLLTQWCNLVRCGVYFDIILTQKNFKNIHFFNKKIHNIVAMRLLGGFGGILFRTFLNGAIWCFGVYFDEIWT